MFNKSFRVREYEGLILADLLVRHLVKGGKLLFAHHFLSILIIGDSEGLSV